MLGEDIAIIILFGFIGASLKYIDASYDDKVFNRKFALALSPVTGIVYCVIIALNQYAAGICLGIVISVILCGKIDNFAFSLIVAIIFTTVVILGVSGLLSVSILTLLVILLCSGIDEIGNDQVDKEMKIPYLDKKRSGFKEIIRNLRTHWFLYRVTSYVGIIFLILTIAVPWVFFFALIAEECTYQLVESIALKKKSQQGIT
ncbi:conserved hypothetical protein [Methanolacinia petrolearia DSM 11571]|uniref:Uncharacterized protein n=1 Tax=Methanolacinia petrolearia (strain DSM 11571 / OCM 486 / SEBR 4847) TaxID=679926 RepID=E1RJS1_METP4|nr:hypothetical protein [Methanolacinia petrolearia]ADN35718.1 conserved hypothetical protein [Methanolacinia petrolearia DSM 11571]